MQSTKEGQELRTLLLSGRNVDGGWGYYRSKTSRLEPTCWAVLALQGDAAPTHLGDALRNWPASNGLLLERAGGEPNYAFHATALLVLGACRLEHAVGNVTLARALQGVKGMSFPQSSIQRQDNSLQGWSWIAETFSWVEPTAWSVLALKKWAKGTGSDSDHERLSEAERLLLDRAIGTGGWNYGNSNMLGQELSAYIPTTAVTLMALQDRRNEPSVERGLAYLAKHATSEPSGFSLALAALALRVYGLPVAAVHERLASQLGVTEALGNHLAMATALVALTSRDTHAFTF